MARKPNLQDVLLTITEHVYNQPPTTMKYPCIKYSLKDIETLKANNKTYRRMNSYLVTLIDEEVDSEINDKILDLEYISFMNTYVADGLNHWVYTLYY